LIGLERERSHIRRIPAGSRSFALLSLAGVMAASFDERVVMTGLVGVSALVTFSYFRTSAEDPGITTAIAALVAYLLGALAFTRPALAVALAVVVASLLVSKARIHHFAREVVSEVEVEDAIRFLVVAFVVLPLLPDRDIGPYGVLNPSKVWLLVVLLTGIGWFGYIGVRALGRERGLLVTGLAGGFVSASATTASMARASRTATNIRPPLAGALLASVATFVQLVIVIGVVDVDVLRRLWPPVAAGAVVLVGISAFVARDARRSTSTGDDSSTGMSRSERPFALRPALTLAAVLTFALFVGRWGADVFGPQGAVLAAFAAGLADAHAGSLAAASLAGKGDITVNTALVAISAALGSNLIVKTALAFTAGGRRFGLGFLACMVAPTIVFGAVMTAVVTTGWPG
jgi:uncharacterized membrane protein (DUF4010 family)